MKKNKYVIRWEVIEFQTVEAESPEAIQDGDYKLIGEKRKGVVGAHIMDASGGVVICGMIK
jgi:hypothetical protein